MLSAVVHSPPISRRRTTLIKCARQGSKLAQLMLLPHVHDLFSPYEMLIGRNTTPPPLSFSIRVVELSVESWWPHTLKKSNLCNHAQKRMREKAECILCTSALLCALLNGVELRPRDGSIIFILGDDPIFKGPKYYQPSLVTLMLL